MMFLESLGNTYYKEGRSASSFLLKEPTNLNVSIDSAAGLRLV